MTEEFPLVSCICITYNRIVLLKKAIRYFELQNYPNKQLVISYPSCDKLTAHVIKKIIINDKIQILKLERPYNQSLGEARNEAISKSDGEYICTWDDDDWYHESRLSMQVQIIQNSYDRYSASILNQLLLYDQTTKKAYLSFLYTWENTLMCKKEIFRRKKYSDVHLGEDSKIIDFLEEEKLLCHISKMSFLYIYIYHMGNTWGYSHFKSFIKRSNLLNVELTSNIIKLLE